jgi:mono/diheme cytochrome c family protein
MSSRLSLLVLAPLAAVAADGVSFNRDIQPILSEYCYHCHGPDAGSRKAKLRLDRPEFAFQPAKSGDVVILKGAADKSPLIQRILNKDPDEVMPPPESHKQLKPAEIELLRRWVNEGAKYEEHWAFLPPQRPVPPTDKTGWAKSPIDAFIIASLTQNGPMVRKPRSASSADLTSISPAYRPPRKSCAPTWRTTRPMPTPKRWNDC